MGKAGEQRLARELVTHPPVEALDKGVLGGLAWSGLVPLDPGLAAPLEHRVRDQLGAVAADDHAVIAAHGDQIGQLAHDPLAQDRGVRDRRQARARHVVNRDRFIVRPYLRAGLQSFLDGNREFGP